MIDPAEARRLLDAEENDRLLALVSPEEVGLAWCRYATRSWDIEGEGDLDWETDPDGWAAELVHQSEFLANEEFVREFLVTISDAASEEMLGWVGAGPLRDCLDEENADQLAWIEAQAARSERFRRALGNMHVSSSASAETLVRLERAAGVALTRSTPYRLARIPPDVTPPPHEEPGTA